MLQPVSVGLKFGFLIVLYLFLFWVATSTLFDLRRGLGGRDASGGVTPTRRPASTQTVDPLAALAGRLRAAARRSTTPRVTSPGSPTT